MICPQCEGSGVVNIDQACHECLGNGWLGLKKPSRLLELAQEIQDHRDRLRELEAEYEAETKRQR